MDLVQKGMGPMGQAPFRDARPNNPLQPSKSISALVEWGKAWMEVEHGIEHGNMGSEHGAYIHSRLLHGLHGLHGNISDRD